MRLSQELSSDSCGENECGAIVVEATLSLTFFIFLVYTILSIITVCYIQARIGVALDSATKELSQYTYLYYAVGVDDIEAAVDEGTSEAKSTVYNTIDGVKQVSDELSSSIDAMTALDYQTMATSLNAGTSTVNDIYSMYADQISENPRGFIMGMAQYGISSLKNEAKGWLIGLSGKALMQKNLSNSETGSADAFLRQYHVKDGLSGLDMAGSALNNDEKKTVQLVVTYKVCVLQLFSRDFTLTFCQHAKSCTWGGQDGD